MSTNQSDLYSAYETGIQDLLNRMGKDHPRYSEALIYQQQLLENITLALACRSAIFIRTERGE